MRYACREVGFDPKIALYSARWDFIVQMVRLNYGISFQPRSIFKRFSFPDIHLLEVRHPIMDHWLELITKKNVYTSRGSTVSSASPWSGWNRTPTLRRSYLRWPGELIDFERGRRLHLAALFFIPRHWAR